MSSGAVESKVVGYALKRKVGDDFLKVDEHLKLAVEPTVFGSIEEMLAAVRKAKPSCSSCDANLRNARAVRVLDTTFTTTETRREYQAL